ncbi:twin-arginine translocase TatA/TatE family subunit [Deinococcus gobiensis]|uniref:Sec-independent protein translocase protein TatA n=1 Tax=Deinococcus gobiensis (strain DSM 21396 / JCM 16679 / CGMCC 1.7299 / I-0) TaxID=745776 RepID=H8GZW7_DEIGI|nr:twin-arginine translocase TatA/TatE family subunit [Deinococcus gobiensis]AFD26279.1 Sec-independent protein translocase protein tatA/E-like protein [Deinococcus gobiensis I-0]
MPNLGMPEILMILVVALVIFGPRKLPELGKTLGSTLREFRRHTSQLTDDLRAETTPAPVAAAQPVAAPTAVVAPVAELVPAAAPTPPRA